jgi:hypothetical protein
MSKTFKDSPKYKQQRTGRRGSGRQRNISVRAVRRDPPDLRKLSRALIQLAVAQVEADARAEAKDSGQPSPNEAAHD